MRNAFTMVELIFVIVIIGILVSIAIPKLVATRDDAKHSALMANTKICINDLISGYKGLGNTVLINDNPACVTAITAGASIKYIDDTIQVSNVDKSLNGNYIFKGTKVSY